MIFATAHWLRAYLKTEKPPRARDCGRPRVYVRDSWGLPSNARYRQMGPPTNRKSSFQTEIVDGEGPQMAGFRAKWAVANFGWWRPLRAHARTHARNARAFITILQGQISCCGTSSYRKPLTAPRYEPAHVCAHTRGRPKIRNSPFGLLCRKFGGPANDYFPFKWAVAILQRPNLGVS